MKGLLIQIKTPLLKLADDGGTSAEDWFPPWPPSKEEEKQSLASVSGQVSRR